MKYRCPECGCEGPFTIGLAIETHRAIDVDCGGCVLESSGGDITWQDGDEMECTCCEFWGVVRQFDVENQKGYAQGLGTSGMKGMEDEE